MSTTKERRMWGRARPSEQVSISLVAENREIQGTVVDISHSGVLIASSELLPVGTQVRVDFASRDRGVQALAVVARHSSRGEPTGMAVVLRHVRLEDRMSLDTLIERAAAVAAAGVE